jgi:hypothetical protein
MQKSTFDAVDHGWVQPGLVSAHHSATGWCATRRSHTLISAKRGGSSAWNWPECPRTAALERCAPYSWSKVFGWRTPVASAGISL